MSGKPQNDTRTISARLQNGPRTTPERFQNDPRTTPEWLQNDFRTRSGLEAEGWRPKAGGWRLKAGGRWYAQAGRRRLEAGGWKLEQCGAVRCGAVRCGAALCGAVRCGCGAAASRRAWLIFCILRLHTSPVVSENLLCRECQFLVIKSRIPGEEHNFSSAAFRPATAKQGYCST